MTKQLFEHINLFFTVKNTIQGPNPYYKNL